MTSQQQPSIFTLFDAIHANNFDAFKYLITEHPLLLSAKSKDDKSWADGMTALHVAALFGRVDIIKSITAIDEHLAEERTEQGWLALHFAAQMGQVEAARVLLRLRCCSYSAVANAQTADGGDTPLLLAALNGKIEMCRFLIEDEMHLGSCAADALISNNRGQRAIDVNPEVKRIFELRQAYLQKSTSNCSGSCASCPSVSTAPSLDNKDKIIEELRKYLAEKDARIAELENVHASA